MKGKISFSSRELSVASIRTLSEMDCLSATMEPDRIADLVAHDSRIRQVAFRRNQCYALVARNLHLVTDADILDPQDRFKGS